MDKRFEDLLLEYVEQADRSKRKGTEETLWREYGTSRAILVMDLSRFSDLTERYGIVYNLAMIQRMHRIAQPVIEKAGGSVVKFEADNCFAVFDEVLPALEAAFALNKAFDEMNLQAQEEFEISVAIGIDFGEILMTSGTDFFGESVNRACKLGEDVAGPREILITETAFRQLPSGNHIQAEPLQLSISGLGLKALSIKYP